MVSVGGADTAVMVWEHESTRRPGQQGDSEDSDTDSEEEGGKLLLQCQKGVRTMGMPINLHPFSTEQANL